ncbi:uncharacterized protein LOC142510580 [Primulina tabacum]|uniref:uncharacterized protein LOC142510580 n=1 Tax=Primulina tabacum TaxID=48773 RepID=UPI003F5926FA
MGRTVQGSREAQFGCLLLGRSCKKEIEEAVNQFMLRSQNPDLLIFYPEIERTARRLRKARREEILAMAENRENDRHNLPDAITIRYHYRPVINTHYSCIARGTINANNFELKPALINMVQQNQFAGTATADPHVHLRTFLDITDTGPSKRIAPITSAGEHHNVARVGNKRTAGVYAVDPITSLTAQVSALTTQIATMNKVSTSNTEGASFIVEESQPPEENVLNPPPGFNTSNGEGKLSFEDLVGTFVSESGKRMARTESRLDNLETHMANIGASLKILESQVGQITKQLTSQPSGALPRTADPNTKEVNVVFIQHEEVGMIEVEEKKVDHKPGWEDKPTPSKGDRGKKGKNYDFDQYIDIFLLPYPHRFLQLKAEFQKKEGLENLKNLHSNIQSAEQEEVAFTGEDDKGKKGNLPQKLQDPGEFIVPCEIGGQLVKKAICDSGASVNITPSSLYEKLGLTRIKPTELNLQLADKSVKVSLGSVKDVELKIDKLKVLAEFVVLDMENSQDVHVILGRPLLAAVGAIIDVKRGKMTMEVEDQLLAIRTSNKSYDPS